MDMQDLIEVQNHCEKFQLSDIPSIVNDKCKSIQDLKATVEASKTKTEETLNFMKKDLQKYSDKQWLWIKYKKGNTKEIIDSTQKGLIKVAESVQVCVRGLEESFGFQNKLAKSLKSLFYLGCSNIAANRSVIRELTNKLTEEELSELAREEMQNVIDQLKEQADVMIRQETISKAVKESLFRLDKKDCLDEERDYEISEIKKDIRDVNDAVVDIEQNEESIRVRQEDFESKLEQKDIEDLQRTKSITKNTAAIRALENAIVNQNEINDHYSKLLCDVKDSLSNSILNLEDNIKQNNSIIGKLDEIQNAQSIHINHVEEKLNEYIKSKNEFDDKQLKEIEELKEWKKRNKLPFVATVFSITAIAIGVANMILILLK